MLKVITLEEFIEEVNRIMHSECCTVMEALVNYAETRDVDFDQLAPYINSSFKDAVREEAENKNMMKKPDDQLLF